MKVQKPRWWKGKMEDVCVSVGLCYLLSWIRVLTFGYVTCLCRFSSTGQVDLPLEGKSLILRYYLFMSLLSLVDIYSRRWLEYDYIVLYELVLILFLGITWTRQNHNTLLVYAKSFFRSESSFCQFLLNLVLPIYLWKSLVGEGGEWGLSLWLICW